MPAPTGAALLRQEGAGAAGLRFFSAGRYISPFARPYVFFHIFEFISREFQYLRAFLLLLFIADQFSRLVQLFLYKVYMWIRELTSWNLFHAHFDLFDVGGAVGISGGGRRSQNDQGGAGDGNGYSLHLNFLPYETRKFLETSGSARTLP